VLGATILTTANAAPRHSQDGQGTYHSQAPLSDSIKDRTGQGGF